MEAAVDNDVVLDGVVAVVVKGCDDDVIGFVSLVGIAVVFVVVVGVFIVVDGLVVVCVIGMFVVC